jgi:hypothetical protein
MHDVERELIKVTSYKTQRKFDDRQDYLMSILNSVMKLTDDDFNNISDEAAAWANAAVEVHNSKNGGELPDFDEVDPQEASEDDEPEAEESEDDVEGTEDADPEDDEPEDDAEGAEDDAEAEPDEEADEPEEKPAKKAKAKAAPPAKPAKAKEKVIKPPKKPKNEDDAVLDKWGCMEGSKASQALVLFEKGATTKEVKDKIGGTYYNILGKMVERGHKMSKDGAIITLTHKSSLASGKAAVKKAKK